MEKLKTKIVMSETKTGVSTPCTFREITSAPDIEKAFKLRYKIYHHTRLNPCLRHNENEIDIDSYDLHSRHFGLFATNRELIGYARVVHDFNKYYNPQVYAVGRKFGFFPGSDYAANRLKNLIRFDYPFLSYPDLPSEIIRVYDSLKNDGIVEPGRLIISEEYRGTRISKFLLESIIALYIMVYNNNHHCFLTCVKDHSCCYKRYGFREIGQKYLLLGNEKLVSLTLYIPVSISSIPAQFHEKFKEMSEEYILTGKITTTL